VLVDGDSDPLIVATCLSYHQAVTLSSTLALSPISGRLAPGL
jgi:hypothetical protein